MLSEKENDSGSCSMMVTLSLAAAIWICCLSALWRAVAAKEIEKRIVSAAAELFHRSILSRIRREEAATDYAPSRL